MRKAWFEYVSKTRKKLARKTKEPVTHRKAMAVASETWPQEKIRIQKRAKREAKKEKV